MVELGALHYRPPGGLYNGHQGNVSALLLRFSPDDQFAVLQMTPQQPQRRNAAELHKEPPVRGRGDVAGSKRYG